MSFPFHPSIALLLHQQQLREIRDESDRHRRAHVGSNRRPVRSR